MLNLTAEAKQAWLAQTRQVNARVTIGTTVYNADKIMSIEYDSGSISGETFQIGSFYQNSIKVVLVGILESLANDNKVKLEFAVKVGQAFEWVNMGTFYVTELDRDRNSNRTSFTAVDASVYLGKNYAPTISFPNSLKNLVTDISNQCGVQVNFASMTHLADVNVTQPPSKYTCRQVISMVAQIHGGFARINRNDQLEVTRLMSSDIELSPSHYLLKGLTKNETTYRTDGIIVKIGENEEDVLKVGTTTGSAVINLENPLMTQTLLDEMWRVVSIISYYPFNLKWRGIPNLEAGDWITIVDKQGTRYRVPNLSYKLSFKGGLSAESSANTTATSNVQHKLRGTLTQRVEDVEGYINATGGRSYTGLDVPDNKYLKKGDTWYKPDGDDTAILVYDGEKWEEVASPEVFRQLQADFDELDRQAKEAFEQVDTLVQESPETKRLAQEAQEAVNLANQEITKLQTSVSDTKTALENAEQEFADSLATTTRELTAKISGIDVGGRNILRGTKDMKLGSGNWTDGTWRQSNTGVTKNVTLTDFPLSNITQGIEITSESTRCGITQDGIKLESGEYTLSYYVKAKTIGTEVWVQVFWNGECNGETKHIILNDTNWTRISVTGNLPVNQDIISAGYIYVETPNSTITVAAPFEHRSNKEAEWNQAPEDFESDLSNTSIELSTKITESAASLRTEMSEKYSTKNDLTALSGDYNSFKEQTAKNFSQQVSSIQTIQTDTTEAQKLANDAYSKAQNAVASATNASSTANTAKNNADKAIADVAALTQTVSNQSTRIDQTSNRIEQVASGVTEIGNVINSQQSGGMNLWRFTKDYDGTKYDKWGQIGATQIYYKKWRPVTTIDGFGVQYITTAWDDLSQRVPVKPNTEYTLSAMIKLGNENSRVAFYVDNGTRLNILVDGQMQPVQAIVNGLSATEYRRVSVTFNTGNANYSYARFEPTEDSSMYMYQPMLNEGKPKPWSPHPDDTQSQIDGINNNIANNYYQKTTVDSKLSTAVSGITAQYTKDINTRLGNYYDKSTIDSKLTIDGQGIGTYVKNTQSKLDNLSVGSDNLIVNGGFPTDTRGWTKTPNIAFGTATHQFYYNGNKKLFIIDSTSQSEGMVSSTRFKVKKNTDYTISFIGFAASNVKSTDVFFLGRKNGESSDHTVIKNIFTYLKMSPGSANTYKATFNTGDSDEGYIRFDHNGSTNGQVAGMFFGEVMLVEGTVAKKYQPSSAEFPTLTQYTEVKQLADRISSTVYDSSTGLTTKVNQLAGKYAIQNLNSYGDVLSSLNLNGGNVRIKGGLIDLDGNVRIQDAFVTNLKANSILANEITAKATTIVNAKIANLDASYITSGYISSDVIKARSISADKIDAKDLSAISANLGRITSGYIGNSNSYWDLSTGNFFNSNGSNSSVSIGKGKILVSNKTSFDSSSASGTSYDSLELGTNRITLGNSSGFLEIRPNTIGIGGSSSSATILSPSGLRFGYNFNATVSWFNNVDRFNSWYDSSGYRYQSGRFDLTNGSFNTTGGAVQITANSGPVNLQGASVNMRDKYNTAYVDCYAQRFSSQSSHSIKTDFEDISMDRLLEAVVKTDIVTFRFKNDTQRNVGFVINDDGKSPYKIDDIIVDDNGKSFNSTTTIGILFGAVKALNKRIEILQGENQLLKAKVETYREDNT